MTVFRLESQTARR